MALRNRALAGALTSGPARWRPRWVDVAGRSARSWADARHRPARPRCPSRRPIPPCLYDTLAGRHRAEKTREQANSSGLAFFRVKLRRQHVVARHRRGHRVRSVGHGGFGHVRFDGHGVERMHEVNVLTISARSRELSVTAGAQLERIPAHVWDLDARRAEQLLDR